MSYSSGKRLARISIISVIFYLILIVVPVLAQTFTADIQVVEDRGNHYNPLGLQVATDVEWMAANNYILATGLDTRMYKAGVLTPHMLTNDYIFWSDEDGFTGLDTNDYQFVTGETALSNLDIVTGYGGYVTVAHDADLEDGVTFEHKMNYYFDTDYWNHDTYLQFTSANSDWVSIPDSPNMDFTDGAGTDEAGSIIAWVYVDLTAAANPIFNHGVAVANQYNFTFYLVNDGKVYFYLYEADQAGRSAWIRQISDNVEIFANQWHQVAVTYDGSENFAGITLYVDGQVVDSTGAIGADGYVGTHNSTQVYEIGSRSGGTLNFGNMGVGELSFYTSELTAAQILDDYNKTHLAGAEGWWKLEEMVVATMPQDSSGNAHHATANTADWMARKAPFQKAGAIYCYLSADDTIKALIPGVATAVYASMTEGENVVKVKGIGAFLQLFVNDMAIPKHSVAIGGGVPGNANDWILGKVPSMEYYSHYTTPLGYDEKQYYIMDYILTDTTLVNSAVAYVGDYDGTFTFGVMPDSLTATISGLEIVEGFIPSDTGQLTANVMGEFNIPTVPTDESMGLPDHEWTAWLAPVAEEAGVEPYMAWWYIAMVCSITALVLVYFFSGHLWGGGMAAAIVIAFFVALGALPWYAIFFAIIIVVFFGIMERVSSL